MLDDRDPRRVELVGGRRRSPAGDAIRLLDERDGDADRPRGLCRRGEVGRTDAAARAVTEHESAARLVDWMQMDARRTMRSLDLASHGAESTLEPRANALPGHRDVSPWCGSCLLARDRARTDAARGPRVR